MKFLFIGGSHDGERINVEDSARHIRVFEKHHTPEDVKYSDHYPVLKVEHYRQFDLQVNNIIFKVYAFDSLLDEHVVDMLLDNYSPKRPCPNDTDGDGNCHKCYRNGGCFET